MTHLQFCFPFQTELRIPILGAYNSRFQRGIMLLANEGIPCSKDCCSALSLVAATASYILTRCIRESTIPSDWITLKLNERCSFSGTSRMMTGINTSSSRCNMVLAVADMAEALATMPVNDSTLSGPWIEGSVAILASTICNTKRKKPVH
jgi:hypothetical protein